MAQTSLPVQTTKEGAVCIDYPTLVSNPLLLQGSIIRAFGSESDCLGIIVVNKLPVEYVAYREKLLLLAERFAALGHDKREKYADPKTHYSFGWSHGKEIMNGKPDTLKGSYYANPVVDYPTVTEEQRNAHPEYYGRNIWPEDDEKNIQGFENAFKDLGRFIFKVGTELAIACQPFASAHLTDNSLTLTKLISTSQTTKARLLHYFPPSVENPLPADDEPVDSWCGFHLDHSLLTGLCSAIYLSHEPDGSVRQVSSPSPASGLYIRTRGGDLTKVAIPADSLAFQTGEALEIATAGKLRATPHCVRVGAGEGAEKVSRETFALFMQPDTTQVIGEGETFGSFSKKVFDEHYEPTLVLVILAGGIDCNKANGSPPATMHFSAAYSGSNTSYEEDQSLLWGTYRPNLYFGLRPRLPQSLMNGLMWFGTQDFNQYQKIRHDCTQSDQLDSYTWTEHDLRQGGVEVIKDGLNNVELKIEWLKVPGGDHGGSWAARIGGKPMKQDKPLRMSMIYYFGLEGLGSLDWESDENDDGITGPIHMSGSTPDLGDFKIRIEDGPNSRYTTRGGHADDFAPRLGKIHYFGTAMPAGDVWKAKDYLYQHIGRRAQQIVMPYKDEAVLPDPAFVLTMGNVIARDSNFYAVQKTFEGAFSFDVVFDSQSAGNNIGAATITNGIESFISRFDARFQSLFPTRHNAPRAELDFSKAITSNLMGGIGYFYGSWIKDNAFKAEWDQEEDEGDEQPQTRGEAKLQPPAALLTATPSRSFFPRGFYWDEGFHLLVIGAWDNDLSLAVLRDWINLIDEDGWVGREQILGEEARSKVPEEFQAQYPSNANPPTLVLAVTAFIERLLHASPGSGPSAAELGLENEQMIFGDAAAKPKTYDTSGTANQHLVDNDTAVTYLRSIYPPLRRHYDWFRTTQRGQIKAYSRKARSRTEAYRWRGRSQDHVLTSGMDDYPRGPPHAGELHLDLISWMGFFTRTMKSIASFLGEKGDERYFAEVETAVLGNLEDLHWNAEEEMYCDLGVNDDDESVHVCHKGYLSLFPFLLGLLPSYSSHLGPILDMLHDPLHLWSPYGLRSLSASHPLFGQGENYWRGPIWIQMNYLALSSLYKVYAAEPGPHQERARKIYNELRDNVISNVFKEYERTGYVWEQYDALTGEGRRSHPFTGWTSLVTLIISEKY